MQITFDSSGGAYYAFYLGSRRISNKELYQAIKAVIAVACSVAAAIILATILEDIVTLGIGIWNDAVSFLAAGASMIPIFTQGLRAAGMA